mgnify:CR=1 FL=1
MLPRLIGLCGGIGAGKSTAAKVLRMHGYTVLPFAAPLKDMLKAIGPALTRAKFNAPMNVAAEPGGTLFIQACQGSVEILSTSTVRLAGSSGANPFACIAAGIACLWGPAHGGANEAALNMLKKEIGAVEFDDNGNIGKRYRRQDEIGTPLCVVIDFDTLQDQAVTVRHRDTMAQTRVKINDLPAQLSQLLETF